MSAPRPLRSVPPPPPTTKLHRPWDSSLLIIAGLVGLTAVYFAAQLVSLFWR